VLNGGVPAPTPMQLKVRALHERIAANFEDADAWLVYADTLLEKADPRGELITCWHGRRDAFTELVTKHTPAVFGPVAADVGSDSPFDLHWHMGTVSGVTLRVPEAAAKPPRHREKNRIRERLLERLGAVLERPVCQFLREYRVEFEGCDGFTKDLLTAIRHGSKLRSYAIEAFTGPERYSMKLEIEPYGFLYGVPDLERLALSGAFSTTRFSMPPFAHENLRVLELESDNFFEPDFEALARSRLPSLERLVLRPRSKHSMADAATLRTFVTSTGFPKLRHLVIEYCDFADDILAALADSPMLANLATLGLRGSDHDRGRLAHSSFAHVSAV